MRRTDAGRTADRQGGAGRIYLTASAAMASAMALATGLEAL